MKTRNIIFTMATICLIAVVSLAQENPSEGLETTTSKTYSINLGDKTVSRTVEISTKRATEVMTKKSDVGKIDQDRVVDGMAMITKTVRIDNDKDDAFDEKIVFSYNSKTPEDFVLISNKNELMVAIDNGENLRIIEDMTLKSKSNVENNTTYIFTNNKGNEIEFMVEEYTTMMNEKSESK